MNMTSVAHGPASGAERGPSDLIRHFQDGGFFVTRTPLLPFSVLIHWNDPDPNHASSDTDQPFNMACRAVLVERLRTVFGRAELAEALFFASARLLDKVEAWLRGQPWPGLELTLSRYLVRMATRSTPFGILAGVSLGRVADTTRLELSGRGSYRRHTRPSMGFLDGIVSAATRSKDVQASSMYHPNSTLHCVYGRYRYTRTTREGVSNPLLDVERTPELERALEAAQSGATLEAIATAVQPLASTPREALEYVQELVDQAIIVPTWLPAVTGPEPFDDVRRVLAETASMHAVAERLHSVCTRLDAADESPLGEHLSQLRALAGDLEHDEPSSHVLQADLLKPAPDLTLGNSVVRQLLRAAELVQRTNTPALDPRMVDFRKRFVERYDSRMVPLMEALDEDLGIGFDHLQRRGDDVLVEGLGLSRAPIPDVTDVRQAVLLRMLTHAIRLGGTCYELDAKTLASFPTREHEELPEAFAVTAQLGNGKSGPTIVAPVVVSPSGIALLARFGHVSEPLRQALASQAAAEQACAGQRLLMDVAHLPNGSIGNVLLRPSLRDAELAYGGRSGASAAAQISISDLHVTVVGKRIELYSLRLGKPVSVRITNAHNYEGWWNSSVYRFLGALQRSEGAGLAQGWSWGLLEASPFLPRVVCEGIVLRRARWRLAVDELEPLRDGMIAQSLAAVQLLRARLAWPRWIAATPDETPLVIDLDNALAVEMLVHAARAAVELTLEEVFPLPDELIVAGPEGRFAAEVIVPFVAKTSKADRSSAWRGELAATPRAARSLVPGSEWLYAKIYVGASELQPVLQAIVHGVLPGLVESGTPEWFFLPYADPELHLRLRIRLPQASLQHEALARLRCTLDDRWANGTVRRIQIDTYEREIERYGGLAGVELAEELFYRDSEACVQLLDICEDDSELRWQVTLLGIARYFDDLALSVRERGDVVSSVLENLRSASGATATTLRAVGTRYRRYAGRLEALLNAKAPLAEDDPYSERSTHIRDVLDARSAHGGRACAQITRLLRDGALRTDRSSLIYSFAHLHAVRMLGQSAGMHELVLYDFLRRQYMMQEARATRARPAQTVPRRVRTGG